MTELSTSVDAYDDRVSLLLSVFDRSKPVLAIAIAREKALLLDSHLNRQC